MRNYVRSRRGGVAKEGALARGARPPGASSGRRRKNRRQNARREAKGGEGGPKGHREHLAERRGAAGRIGGRGGDASADLHVGIFRPACSRTYFL